MTHVTIVASPARPTPGALEARDFIWPDEAACSLLAARLAHALRPGLLEGGSFYVELHGTLGAGKTTFTRHLLRALGVAGRIKSPSYAVVEPHELPGLNIQHFDFYRFDDPREWEDAGFRDLFAAPGLKLAEWPEKAGDLLPVADLRIDIRLPADGGQGGAGETREVRVQARTGAGRRALDTLSGLGRSDDAAGEAGGEAAGVHAHG